MQHLGSFNESASHPMPMTKFQTCDFESQLSADHLGISSTPEVITHSTPLIAIADLHASTSDVASLESDGSLCTSGTPHSSIFEMSATMYSKTRMGTVSESGLSSTTPDIRQPDLPGTIGETSGQGNSTCMNQFTYHNNKDVQTKFAGVKPFENILPDLWEKFCVGNASMLAQKILRKFQ